MFRSRSGGHAWYIWLAMPLVAPIRCGRCTRRFYRFRPLALLLPKPAHR
ncbi:MAG: hypothetical protein PHO07_21340 [Pirellulales bacterium]|nr:hypothetical protein [Pirellulales bacterium]NLZ01730.1 hypothetical protein [Pirellulaceae bacterium]